MCWSRRSWLSPSSFLSGPRAKRCGIRCRGVDPFGLSSQFVGLDNFLALFQDPYYLDSFGTTIKFSTMVTVSGLLISLFFAALVDYVVRGQPLLSDADAPAYAVAPAVAAVLWIFCSTPDAG